MFAYQYFKYKTSFNLENYISLHTIRLKIGILVGKLIYFDFILVIKMV